MLNLNQEVLSQVVETACRDAAAHGRWLVAIGRALVELETNPYIERADHGGLLIGSPSGEVYWSNGTCGCTAYKFETPCWHRAAARLVARHDEMEATRAVVVEAVETVVVAQLAPLHERLARANAQIQELFS